MLQNFQFKLSEVKINNEVLYTILSAHLIQEGFYDLKGHGEIMILPNQANTQVLHGLVIAFRKVCPPSSICLAGEVYTSYYFT